MGKSQAHASLERFQFPHHFLYYFRGTELTGLDYTLTESSLTKHCAAVAFGMATCSGFTSTYNPNPSTTTKICQEIFRRSSYCFSLVLMSHEPKHRALKKF